jgi:hypothetical protein
MLRNKQIKSRFERVETAFLPFILRGPLKCKHLSIIKKKKVALST